MRTAVLLFLQAGACLAQYSACQPLVIRHDKVTGGSHAEYVLTVLDTDPTLATVSNGGRAVNAGGLDIVFASDARGQNLLRWDPPERYNPVTGEFVTHVQVGAVSNASDRTIYRCVGNAQITSFQGGLRGEAWPAEYRAVYHLGNGSTLNAADFTASGYDGTVAGPTATTSPLGGAVNIQGEAQFVNLGTGAGFRTAAPITVEFWAKPASTSGDAGIVSSRDGLNGYGWGAHVTDGKWHFVKYGVVAINSQANAALNAWTHVTWVVGTDNKPLLYLNGVVVFASGNGSPIARSLLGSAALGAVQISTTPAFGVNFNGAIDEVRVITAALTPERIATDYQNQSAPSGFYDRGEWTVNSATTPTQVQIF